MKERNPWTCPVPMPESAPGVYTIILDGVISYIGESVNLRQRIHNHSLGVAVEEGMFKGTKFKTISIEYTYTADHKALERELIARYQPVCNQKNRSTKKLGSHALASTAKGPIRHSPVHHYLPRNEWESNIKGD